MMQVQYYTFVLHELCSITFSFWCVLEAICTGKFIIKVQSMDDISQTLWLSQWYCN